MGDPVRALVAKAILGEIKRLDLVKNVKETGEYLYDGLQRLSNRFPTRIMHLRGQGEGTFIAWDETSVESRDKFLQKMKKFGVNIGGTGEASVRLRPMLVFGKRHVDIFLERLEACLASDQ
jgi:4-aminobutyrate aminotransferase / (S)-3-amino-2-methylpropionate transaminase